MTPDTESPHRSLEELFAPDVPSDKKSWGAGPWQTEPDGVRWVDTPTSVWCAVARNFTGSWVGYVGIPKAHPWHGKAVRELEREILVHGGVTYAGGLPNLLLGCPAIPRTAGWWWVGFDCAHAGDVMPAMREHMRLAGIYRDLPYAQAHCHALALQAFDALHDVYGTA